jgi:hypothetical protein
MLWKYTERLSHINYLIKQKATGCPKEFAKKLEITERAWYKWRDSLVNDLGLPIDYCPVKRTYFYKEDGTFEMGFRKLSDIQKSNISGGNIFLNFFSHCTFSSVSHFSFVSPHDIVGSY